MNKVTTSNPTKGASYFLPPFLHIFKFSKFITSIILTIEFDKGNRIYQKMIIPSQDQSM